MRKSFSLHFVLPTICALAFFASEVNAQQRTLINFQLRTYLKSADPASMVDLFLQGNASDVARAALAHGGVVKMATRNWVSARMPVSRVEELNNEKALRSIEFTTTTGQTMNDSMRVKSRIDLVQQGLSPLVQGYDGAGVIMGVIDSGLDFTHPDFLDSLGNTRVLKYWDQHYPFDAVLTPQPYGYGQQWDSAAINAGSCPATDPFSQAGHGTGVTGSAAGNGGHDHRYIGSAPKADIIFVATDFNHANWSSTVVDGIQYIFDQAAALGRPAVVNLSIGEALGSHDGLDPAALLIDDMLTTPGRSVVCAAGNSGCWGGWHAHTVVTPGDTLFSWYRYHSGNQTVLGVPCVYWDLWADTANFNQVQYSIGADRKAGGFAYRGRIPFRNINGTIGAQVDDTLKSFSGNRLGVVSTFGTVRGGQYHLEVAITPVDSAAAYYYRFMSTGSGRFDSWAVHAYGESQLLCCDSVPDVSTYPPMAHFVVPNDSYSLADAWACSPHVITVGNYINEHAYTAVNGNAIVLNVTEGLLSGCSSRGPTRTGLVKPDLAAPGDITFGPVPLAYLDLLFAQNNIANINKIADDSLHMRGGGTSLASPGVAGAAALYLQKCPMATADEIRSMFMNTARTDNFTGAVPNNSYGYGKLDAFAAMIGRVHLSGDTVLCSADSVMINGPGDYSTYQWSTGSTDHDVYAHGAPLSLMAINYSGCTLESDTLLFTVLPSPVAPVIIENGSTLDAGVTGVTYQWFKDGAAISGGNGQVYDATHTGDYYVNVTAPNGCAVNSNVVNVIFTGVKEPVEKGVNIWPSPTSELLHVRVDGTPWISCEVVDAAGRVAIQRELHGSTGDLYVGSLAPGTYALRFRTPGVVRVLRFEVR